MKHLILFATGGTVYICFELIWRGYTHWTMFVVGGVVLILIGMINNWLDYETPLITQCIMAAIIITMVEFAAGMILNVWLGLNIWHYTVLDFMGQVSLPYMALWLVLSALGIVLDDFIRWKLFGEQKPYYRLF